MKYVIMLFVGCNSGIGKVTALELAKQSAKIIMGCRNLETAKVAQEEIKSQSGNDNIILKKLDLSSFASVREFAAEVNQEEEKIDLLINNAGIMSVGFGLTEDGYEKQFAVNHLGHFLLTHLLLDLVKKAESARIVVLASRVASRGSTDFEDVNYEKSTYGPNSSYSRSKRANVLFANELSRRLEGTQVTAYSLHPGIVKTELFRNLPGVARFFLTPARAFMKTVEQGAKTTLYCALKEGIEEHSGQYFAGSKLASFPHDKELAGKLWDLSERLVGIKEQSE